MRTITYEDVLKKEDKYIMVDVRTSKEHSHSTIPGALNIPLLQDDDHRMVGTIYKQFGRKEATKKALEVFGPNLLSIYEQFESLVVRNKEIVVFCARGGMRSTTLVSFLQTLAIPVLKLDFGYKGYRNYVMTHLESLVKGKSYITLYGNTGVGKTKILQSLESRGYDVLDLELCANHRGSLLGHIGLGSQMSQKMFESLVFDNLRTLGNFIIVEGESKRIGKVILPNYLYDAIHQGYKVVLSTTLENRVANIEKNYLANVSSNEEVIEGLNSLKKYIPLEIVNGYIDEIQNNNFKLVIESLIINYYDKKYKISNNQDGKIINFTTTNEAVLWVAKYVDSIYI
ncbi:MAG: tRNA 2-selenouridine(34) synthase MnmH [Bacilli bacterium]